MKLNVILQDNTCPQTPAIREFAKEQMQALFKKNPQIASIRLKVRQLPSRGPNHIYRIRAIATGRGIQSTYNARSITVRAGLKSIRAKYEASPRAPIYTRRELQSNAHHE